LDRVVVAVDGSNLYHLCKLNFGNPHIDIGKFAEWAVAGRTLIRTYYYNCPLPESADLAQQAGQQKFLAALKRIPYLEVRLGRLVQRERRCPDCQAAHVFYEEKGVDMRIGIDLLVGAHADMYDVAVLVSGDADLCEAVRAVKNFGKHVEVVEFPTGTSRELVETADVIKPITGQVIQSLFFPRVAP